MSPRLRRVLPAVLVVLAAAVWALTTLGSSGSSGSPTAAAQSVSSRSISWLGMEIQTLPPGVAVVETVKLGSEGDQAGLESGDVITRINNHAVNGTGDIAAAIHGLHRGDRVLLQISQGSSLYAVQATLAGPPSAYP
jgi:S1-C subfamily serine protease